VTPLVLRRKSSADPASRSRPRGTGRPPAGCRGSPEREPSLSPRKRESKISVSDQLRKRGREQTNRSRQLRNLSDGLVRYSHGIGEDGQSLVRSAKSIQSERFPSSNRQNPTCVRSIRGARSPPLGDGRCFGEFSRRQVDSLLLYLCALLLRLGALLLRVGTLSQRPELGRHLLHGMSEFGQLSGEARYVLVSCNSAEILRPQPPRRSRSDGSRRQRDA
jgi:hypothetical protein